MVGHMLDMSCRVCGEREVELFLDLGDQPHCNRLIPPEMADRREPYFPLHAGFCRNCTLVQIDHTIPKEDMFSDYPYVSGTTKTLVSHFRDTAERLVRRYGLGPPDLVVDIGSNDGTWLKQYRPFGLRVLGVEPATNVVELARRDEVPTLNAFFNEATADRILAEQGPASLMTAAGVFFHLEELHSVVDGVVKLLKPDGVFCVQAIYLGGMIENTAFDQIYHEHLCYYTLKSLEKLFRRHGLEVFDVNVVPIHGGSLEAHVGFVGVHPIGASVVELRDDEEGSGYGLIETYRSLAKDVWRAKVELVTALERQRQMGKIVRCYGAPAKDAARLNSFDICTEFVAVAAENPLEFGKMYPRSSRPGILSLETVRPASTRRLEY